MKSFIILFAVIFVASADEWKIVTHDDLIKYRGECIEAQKLPEDHVEKIKKWDFPDDVTTHMYLECVFGKMGLFNSETGFNVDHLVKQLSHGEHDNPDTVKAEIEKCIDNNEQKTSSCEWLYRGVKCFFAKNLSLVRKSVAKE